LFTELGVTGSAVAQRNSASNKERLDEQRVIAALRDEGLIQRPMSRVANGLSFEIVANEPGASDYMFDAKVPKRPARLEKLEKRRKKKRVRTEEEIAAKLERAELRRKVRFGGLFKRLSLGLYILTYQPSFFVQISLSKQQTRLICEILMPYLRVPVKNAIHRPKLGVGLYVR
jgi:hypothetical protein